MSKNKMQRCNRFIMVFLGLVFALVLSPHGQTAPEKSFFRDHARGWFWYEDPLIDTLEGPKKEENEKPSQLTPIEKPKTATERLNDVKEHLAELKAKAILEPTSENVKAYQKMQMNVVNQSEAFSKAWMMNVYMNPSLDENVSNPSAQGARFVVYENERKNTDKIITGLKEIYGLFYFYSGSCAYCKAFAPIVKQFAGKYGWDVMAISLDGAPSDVFLNWQSDNGISQQWNVQTVPAVFAVNPENNDVIPVANGFTAIDAMEKRIVAIVNGGNK